MRLLHILSQRPGRSGSGVFFNAMVRESARCGHDQHVIVAGPPGTSADEVSLSDGHFSPVIFPSAAAPFPLPGNSDVMPYPSTVFSQMTELQVDQYLAESRRVMEAVRERFRPQMVHAHHLWLMTALARDVFHDVPVIATSHNAELRQAIKAPHLAERVLGDIRRLDKIGVLTVQSVADTVQCFGVDPARIAVCGAGFRDDLFHCSEDAPVNLPEAFGAGQLITFIGRLSTAKGIPFLLQAAAQLERRSPDCRILLVGASGSGPDGQAIDQLVMTAGERVVHLGTRPQNTIAEILRASALFVLPSLFEGLPLTMLEALACGCPTVVSGLPTIQSWVPQEWQDSRDVELIEPLQTTRADEPVAGDVPRFVMDLTQAIERQLLRGREEKKRRRLAAAMKPHSWPRVFERYDAIYRELAGAGQ